MAVALIFALQAVAGPGMSESMPLDLSEMRSSGASGLTRPRCGEGDGSEIVVCARRSDEARYRIAPPATQYDPPNVRAEAGLGGGATVGVYAHSVELPGAQTSNRIMITLKLPF